MNQQTPIRILEEDNNRRGDLFGRLMADLFVALGYTQPRLNIHTAGREIDLAAQHRLEPRTAIAECKATASPTGGDDINKFVGSLDAERKGKNSVIGYFISLAGFRESAIQQEKHGRRTKIITLNGSQVVDELVKGRIIISKERATELAGRCCDLQSAVVLDPTVELLAHERGWIWCVCYSSGKVRTHFALIHSDGTPLARELADEVVASDERCGGTLHRLQCLNPNPAAQPLHHTNTLDALEAYRRYLANECGFIQLDGLPADADVGSRRLRLESLFVPLHLDVAGAGGEQGSVVDRQNVGGVLTDFPRLAILSPPGGGKSTLIKRLATAYVNSDRRDEISDDLPARDWLPLFFRCRELRELARGSFADLVSALSMREPVRQHAPVFRDYVDRALLDGRVILLVDGLDEISDPGDRAAFVSTIRAALQAYPSVAMVATSREAGFRHVAAHLAPVCTTAKLSPFNADDVQRLSVAWHREVVGDTDKVRADAEELARTIAANDRIQRLAVNPLLLTTLLLVRRWIGSLPTRRAALYGEAVKVLLRTWNTEGHDPIPEEEALPQLCYVGSAMMLNGVQKISRPGLALLLQEARDALPTELGYVKGTVDEFIHRVEDRSSLLMMTGHDVENGRLVEFFEFRHLTFQEYLTARAMIQGWHPGRSDDDSLVSVLEPHLAKEGWKEVVPLAAVMGGKETEALIRLLTEKVHALTPNERYVDDPVLMGLYNCLADEAAARPETIKAAIRALVPMGESCAHLGPHGALARGRYGRDLREEARQSFLQSSEELDAASGFLESSVYWQTIGSEDATGYAEAAQQFHLWIRAQDTLTQCEGALGFMFLSFRLHRPMAEAERNICAPIMCATADSLIDLLFDDEPLKQYSSAFALIWLSACRVWAPSELPRLIARLLSLALDTPRASVRRMAIWAMETLPLGTRDDDGWQMAEFRRDIKRFKLRRRKDEEHILLLFAWYTRSLTDAVLTRRVIKVDETMFDERTVGRTWSELRSALHIPPGNSNTEGRRRNQLQ